MKENELILFESQDKTVVLPVQMKDDPARHERLAAIGKNETPIRLHKKDAVFDI